MKNKMNLIGPVGDAVLVRHYKTVQQPGSQERYAAETARDMADAQASDPSVVLFSLESDEPQSGRRLCLILRRWRGQWGESLPIGIELGVEDRVGGSIQKLGEVDPSRRKTAALSVAPEFVEVVHSQAGVSRRAEARSLARGFVMGALMDLSSDFLPLFKQKPTDILYEDHAQRN